MVEQTSQQASPSLTGGRAHLRGGPIGPPGGGGGVRHPPVGMSTASVLSHQTWKESSRRSRAFGRVCVCVSSGGDPGRRRRSRRQRRGGGESGGAAPVITRLLSNRRLVMPPSPFTGRRGWKEKRWRLQRRTQPAELSKYSCNSHLAPLSSSSSWRRRAREPREPRWLQIWCPVAEAMRCWLTLCRLQQRIAVVQTHTHTHQRRQL